MKLASLLGCVAAPGESRLGFAPQSYGGPFRTYKAQHSRESLHTGAKGSLKSIASHGLEGFAKVIHLLAVGIQLAVLYP